MAPQGDRDLSDHPPDTDPATEELTDIFQRIAERQGYVSNLYQLVAHAPSGLRVFAELDNYCRNETALTERQRQLAILVAIRDVHYGWLHHEPLARAAGVTDEQITLIREGRAPRDLEPEDKVICEYAFEIAACRRLPPRVQEVLVSQLTPRQIVDTALLTGFYMAAAAIVIALDVEIEAPEVLAAEQAWQARLHPPPAPEPAAEE